MDNRLTSTQKWQLAIRLLVLFSPLLLYVNLPESARNTTVLIHSIPFFILISIINLGLYYLWISATDWCQRQLSNRFSSDILMQFNWRSILLTFLISFSLALLFTKVLPVLLFGAIHVVKQIWPSLLPSRGPSPFPPMMMAYIGRANNVFSIVIMLTAFYLTISERSYRQLKDVQLKAEKLEKEALLSQFGALKSQLSPHFLFNSLSILTSLIHEDVDLSEQFIKRLSKAYRYILEQRDQDLVPLSTELDFIQAYTFLLKIRFENKFDVLIDVPQAAQLQYRIAPLTLQLLVENAVKHNRMSQREKLKVRIYVEQDWLLVENPIQARDQPEPSTGIGLSNITNRYSLLTDRPVWCGEEQGQFVVKIPLLT
ncbi:sensor histidine kinase [Spirosoma panaciterrae]|uniref:sensor histidine kinase n=1 Tax=Spirosoma panaciterrae TaxID=496058 RepID=UPI000374E19B|nr:histidine kinase [Spirosoma panaciterrae]